MKSVKRFLTVVCFGSGLSVQACQSDSSSPNDDGPALDGGISPRVDAGYPSLDAAVEPERRGDAGSAPSDATAPPGPLPPTFPPDEFIFGFNQVAGTGPGKTAWPLTDAELRVLHDDVGINAIRLFVHPAFVGLPQKTWNGPESLRYSSFPASSYVFNRPETPEVDSLDEIIVKLQQFGIRPILLPLVVDEYQEFIYKTDLTSMNSATETPPRDYAGIVARDEVAAFATTVAGHVHQKFGVPFGVVFTELCGGGTDGTLKRTSEQAAWSAVASAIRKAAPLAEVFGPELCVGMSWFSTAQANQCGNFDPVFYGDSWPRFDRFENYASVFDAVAISFYGIAQSDVQIFCPGSTRLRETTNTDLFLVRNHIGAKKWLYAEVGWGSDQDDEMHLAWAEFLFGMDHSRGLLVWQAKDNEGSLAGIWDSLGNPRASMAAWKLMGPTIAANHTFFGAHHSFINADGLPTDGPQFSETDPLVVTRKLSKHVVIYSQGPTGVQFNQAGGLTLNPTLNGGAPAQVQHPSTDVVTVTGLTPKRLYILALK